MFHGTLLLFCTHADRGYLAKAMGHYIRCKTPALLNLGVYQAHTSHIHVHHVGSGIVPSHKADSWMLKTWSRDNSMQYYKPAFLSMLDTRRRHGLPGVQQNVPASVIPHHMMLSKAPIA